LHLQREWEHLPGQWKCPVDDCGGKLRQYLAGRYIQCPDCGTVWHEDAYELLGRMLGQEYAVTVDQAAAWAKVHRRTIRRWIDAGWINILPGTPSLVDRRDIAVLLVRRSS
jgi:rubredoxin